jgi:hypothetical protein
MWARSFVLVRLPPAKGIIHGKEIETLTEMNLKINEVLDFDTAGTYLA